MTQADCNEYFRKRERIERLAAANAACPEARRVHQKLADAYAERVQAADGTKRAIGASRSTCTRLGGKAAGGGSNGPDSTSEQPQEWLFS